MHTAVCLHDLSSTLKKENKTKSKQLGSFINQPWGLEPIARFFFYNSILGKKCGDLVKIAEI